MTPPRSPEPAEGRTTSGGCGPTSPVSFASFDPASSSWRTFQASLLSTEAERFPRSWEAWPRWILEPTSGSRTSFGCRGPSPDASASSSWPALHTPTTGDTGPSYDHRVSPGSPPRAVPVPNLAAQVDELLPSPAGRDWRGTNIEPGSTDVEMVRRSRGQGGASSLPDAVRVMLPTPGAWLGRREADTTADPTREASKAHEGATGDVGRWNCRRRVTRGLRVGAVRARHPTMGRVSGRCSSSRSTARGASTRRSSSG